MPTERHPGYDTSQPGLAEGINYVEWYRNQLDHEGEPGQIITVPGLGYGLQEIPEAPDHYLALSLDGTGTKIKESFDLGPDATNRDYYLAGEDAVAMNLNDALMVRGTVRAVGDMLDLPFDDAELKEGYIHGFAAAAYSQGVRVLGGETAVMTTEGFGEYPRLGAAAVMFVRKPTEGFQDWLWNLNRFKPGDTVIGVPSSGMHSNGFTGARQKLQDAGLYGRFLEDLKVPTRQYYREIHPLVTEEREGRIVNAMVSVTGEAFKKPLSMLPEDCELLMDQKGLDPQPIFRELSNHYSDQEMYERFNNGVGFLLGVPERHTYEVVSQIEGAAPIGIVHKGQHRVRVRSAYTDKWLSLTA